MIDGLPGSGDRLLCGWRVRSELYLPDLPPWPEDSDQPVDVQIIFGVVSERLETPLRVTPFMQIDGSGTVLVTIYGVARYRVEAGRRVVIASADGADPSVIRVFLLSSVLGMLCHQRGLLPLHAAALAIGGRIVALAGMSGAGKSTLAARLLQRGHRLITDDLCILDPHELDPHGNPAAMLRPFGAHVKLWQDSLETLGLDSRQMTINRRGQRKYLLPLPRPAAETAEFVPLTMMLVLKTARSGAPDSVEWVSGFDRFTHILDHVYRRQVAASMGRKLVMFEDASRLVAANVKIGLFHRKKEFSHLDRQVSLIEKIAAETL